MDARAIEADLVAFAKREVFAPDVQVTAEMDLIAAGFDSMSLVRMLLFVETTYGVWVPAEQINEASLKNFRSLAETIFRIIHAQ
jgi:acyl carrier protein